MLDEYKRVKNSISPAYEPLLANRIQSLGNKLKNNMFYKWSKLK